MILNLATWLKNNWFKVGLLIAIFIVVISFSYYYIVFLPNKEQVYLQFQEQERLTKEKKEEDSRQLLDSCIKIAESLWRDQSTHFLALKKEKVVCNIGCEKEFTEVFDKIDSDFKEGKGDCFKRYPLR